MDDTREYGVCVCKAIPLLLFLHTVVVKVSDLFVLEGMDGRGEKVGFGGTGGREGVLAAEVVAEDEGRKGFSRRVGMKREFPIWRERRSEGRKEDEREERRRD